MTNLSCKQLFVFGKAKLNVRQLVIFNCKFGPAAKEKPIEVKRVFRDATGKFDFEDSNITPGIFVPAGTAHINDFFVTESFGICLSIADEESSFALQENRQDDLAIELLTDRSESGQPLYFVQTQV